MTQSFNQYEVEQIAHNASYDPELAPFGQIALTFLETINANSDGWAYWKAGHRAAARFLTTLDKLSNPRTLGEFSREPKPTIADLKRALAPMKSLLTKHKLPALPTD